jgi:hypothetical protein
MRKNRLSLLRPCALLWVFVTGCTSYENQDQETRNASSASASDTFRNPDKNAIEVTGEAQEVTAAADAVITFRPPAVVSKAFLTKENFTWKAGIRVNHAGGNTLASGEIAGTFVYNGVNMKARICQKAGEISSNCHTHDFSDGKTYNYPLVLETQTGAGENTQIDGRWESHASLSVIDDFFGEMDSSGVASIAITQWSLTLQYNAKNSATRCISGSMDIPDYPESGATSTINFPYEWTVQSVILNADIEHGYYRDLTMTLAHNGVDVPVTGGAGSNTALKITNLELSNSAWGSASGEWSLRIKDNQRGQAGTLKRLCITVNGQ